MKKTRNLLLLMGILALAAVSTSCGESGKASSGTTAAAAASDQGGSEAQGKTEKAGEEKSSEVKSMSGADLQALEDDKDKKETALVIDVRSPKEYAEGHVKFAVNMPLDTLKDRLGAERRRTGSGGGRRREARQQAWTSPPRMASRRRSHRGLGGVRLSRAGACGRPRRGLGRGRKRARRARRPRGNEGIGRSRCVRRRPSVGVRRNGKGRGRRARRGLRSYLGDPAERGAFPHRRCRGNVTVVRPRISPSASTSKTSGKITG